MREGLVVLSHSPELNRCVSNVSVVGVLLSKVMDALLYTRAAAIIATPKPPIRCQWIDGLSNGATVFSVSAVAVPCWSCQNCRLPSMSTSIKVRSGSGRELLFAQWN